MIPSSFAGSTTRGSTGSSRTIREPGSPTGLAFDRSTAVWMVDAEEGLIAVAGDGSFQPITVSGLARKTTLIAALPSRDGTRAALIVRRGPRTGLLLGRVIRASGGATTITINEPIRVESRLVEVVDASWSGADTLSVLGSESAGALQVFDIDIARGSSTARGTPEAPVTVSAAPGLPTLVAAADGLVYESTGGAWQERVRGSSPAYPG